MVLATWGCEAHSLGRALHPEPDVSGQKSFHRGQEQNTEEQGPQPSDTHGQAVREREGGKDRNRKSQGVTGTKRGGEGKRWTGRLKGDQFQN